MGLIPFCLENPRLHFERRVNIWTNVLPSGMHSSTDTKYYWGLLEARDVSRCFEPWLSEAAVLDGIPPGSYSLVFDGDPLPELSLEIFEEVKHDVAYQLAVEQYLQQKHGLVPLHLWRQHAYYLSEMMPRALEDLIGGESFIRCNFETGNAWDEEELLHRFASLSEEAITSNYMRYRFTKSGPNGRYETLPPLPSWYDIRFSQILPAIPDSRRSKEGLKPPDFQVGYKP